MPYNVKEVIRRLKECIEKSGYTYEQLEKMTGISRSSLQRYANGVTAKIPVDAIQIIAEALGVKAEYILGWDDTPPTTEESVMKLLKAEYDLNDADIDFVRDYIKLAPAEREALRTAIEAIKKIKDAD